tara:strand:+ start:667 stop:1350 length:684 start_codon:yes stop_codon:yes gene_type:complete
VATFDSLVKDVLPYVPGCPDTLVETNLRSSTIELCEKSKAYKVELDVITSISGVFEYEFDQPTGTDVHQILWMTYDGEDMDPTSPRSLELNYPDWRDRTGTPEVFLQISPDLFYVAPVPSSTKTNGFRVSVALKPSRSSNNIDTDFSTDYRDGIIFGALWRLLRIPAREWSDPRAAADYRNLFDEQVREAEARSRAGDLGVRRLVKYKGVGLNPRKRYRRYGKEIDY